jgi:hypothetical protein
MLWISRVVLALAAIWLAVLIALLVMLWLALRCEGADCGGDAFGAALLVALWGWGGIVLLPTGLLSLVYLSVRFLRAKRRRGS